MHRLALFTALPVVLLLSGVAGTAHTAEYSELTLQQQRRAAALYGQLKCPVCKSQSVAASTSFLSEQMKTQIRAFVAEGKSDEEIIDYYVARYGDWILMSPRMTGTSLLAWVMPIAAVLMVSLWLLLLLRRWARRTRAVDDRDSVVIDTTRAEAYRRRIDDLVNES